jgi:AraC family transcriptional regulator of adaptative response / DNA-3-methyladenine glycosylase II
VTRLVRRRLRLAFAPPMDWASLLGFLGARAIPGVEAVDRARYRRAFRAGGGEGVLAAAPAPDGAAVDVEVALTKASALGEVERRVRRLLDLDADPGAVAARLGKDPLLRPRVAAHPGLRVPGAWEPFELAVRAVLGQQISVAAARTLAGRIAAAHGAPVRALPGGPDRVFPGAEDLARAGAEALLRVGLTRARAACLAGLARAVADDPALLAPLAAEGDLARAVARLDALPGIGPWTAHYVAMRALGARDAFPEGDLGLVRALSRGGRAPSPAALARRAERWRPFRAYAALHLWTA